MQMAVGTLAILKTLKNTAKAVIPMWMAAPMSVASKRVKEAVVAPKPGGLTRRWRGMYMLGTLKMVFSRVRGPIVMPVGISILVPLMMINQMVVAHIVMHLETVIQESLETV